MGISAVSATFFCSFPDFWAGFEVLFWEFLRFQLLFSALFRIFGRALRCCFGNFCGFSYFFLLFSGFLAGFVVLFWGFLRFQLLFSAFFRLFWLGFGCCLGNLCGFSYFFCSFPDFWRGLGCCLGNLCGFSYPRPACYAINLWLLYIMIIEKSSIF